MPHRGGFQSSPVVTKEPLDALLLTRFWCDGAHRSSRTEVPPTIVALRRTICYATFMSKTIAQRELRNENAKVIDEVVAGESFVVTRNGIPVAELRPLFAPRRTVVPKSAIADFVETGPRIDAKRFRADFDNFVDQEF